MPNATAILDRVEKTLLDEANDQWSRIELLDYLNAGIRWICLNKPDAYVVDEAVVLDAGKTRQTLPAGGYQVLDVTMNMGTDGTTPGSAIRQTTRTHLDNSLPTWHTVLGTAVENFMFDARNPKVFWTYPPLSGTHYVQVVYSAVPTTDATDSSTELVIDGIYETPLEFYILAMAYSKNAKRGDTAKYTSYMTQAAQLLGLNLQQQKMNSPMPALSDENPMREPR